MNGNKASVAPFWSDLYRAGAEVVLNGHDHDYERFAPQDPSGHADPDRGIREFVVGTGRAAFAAFKTFQPNSRARIAGTNGVIKLTLHPDGYDWQFVKSPGGPAKISGSATNERSGVAGYELEKNTIRDAFADVKISSATSTAKTLRLQPGDTHRFRVRATDGAGNISGWAKGRAFRAKVHQEGSNANLVYAGRWAKPALSSAYGGGVKYAGTK